MKLEVESILEKKPREDKRLYINEYEKFFKIYEKHKRDKIKIEYFTNKNFQ